MSQPVKPVLQKPPGYRNPTRTTPSPRPPPVGPARKPILPTSKKRKPRKGCFRTCCCATCLVLVVLILLLAVAGCLFYLFFRQEMPVFHLQSVRFPRFNVTTDGQDGPALDSEATVRIQVRNENGVLKVNFGKMEVGLKGADVDLGTGTLPPFSQATKNTTVLKLAVQVKGMLIENGSVERLRNGFKSKSLVMGTEVETEVGVGGKGWNTMKVPIKAICDGVSFKDVEGGAAVPKCKITLFKLIHIRT